MADHKRKMYMKFENILKSTGRIQDYLKEGVLPLILVLRRGERRGSTINFGIEKGGFHP